MNLKKWIILSSFLIICLAGLGLYFWKIKADTATSIPEGYPLPTLSHWDNSHSAQELAMINRNHHITLSLPIDSLSNARIDTVLEAKNLNLPLSFPHPQWEQSLIDSQCKTIDASNDPATGYFYFTGTDPMQSANPCFIDKDTKRIMPALDPLGPVGQIAVWSELGENQAENQILKFIEEIYPDPPAINFLSNNEAPKMGWQRTNGGDSDPSILQSARYNKLYLGKEPGASTNSTTTIQDFRRRIIGDDWIDRYSSMNQAFRSKLAQTAWQINSFFSAYIAFGTPSYRRWGGWGGYNTHTSYDTSDSTILSQFPELNRNKTTIPRISAWPYVWDGASPEVYLAPYTGLTDNHVMSPQIEAMNWVFMLEETRRRNPNFWFELSTWDGHVPLCTPEYNNSGYCTNNPSAGDKRAYFDQTGHPFTPDRYEGMTQFVMWLTRANSVREFRFPGESWDSEFSYFQALSKSVDRVHNQPILTNFWKYGSLVENTSRKHPYNAIESTEGYTDTDILSREGVGRWYLLNTNLLDQSALTTLGNQEIPVYALALTKGSAPAREWLVYASSPLQDRQDVTVTIPGYKDITVDVSVAGSFFRVSESTGQITAITDAPAQLAYLVISPENAVINAGTTKQFTVKGLDQYDGDFPTDIVTWSATGGTINESGLFTAGITAGDFTITAKSGSIDKTIPVKIGNLAGEWTFDEQAGSLVMDKSGRENHCRFKNARWGIDDSHKYAEFVATDSSYVACNSDDEILNPNEISVASWVRLDDLRNNGVENYIVKNSYGYGADGYYLSYYHNTALDTPANTGGYFTFYVRNAGVVASVSTYGKTNANLSLGQWYFVAATFKPGQYQRIYINGQLITEKSTGIPAKLDPSTSFLPELKIGQNFSGKLDKVSIFNQALSDMDIAAIYSPAETTTPKIVISKKVDKNIVIAGEIITYTISYQNIGDKAANNLIITDNISRELEIISASNNGNINGQAISWTLPSLGAHSEGPDLVIRCKVKAIVQ